MVRRPLGWGCTVRRIAARTRCSAMLGVLALGALITACAPDTEGGASLIDAPRVLALRSEPAEAAPGEAVTWSALFAGPDGLEDPARIDWALCTQRKPLTTAGPISLRCLERRGKYLQQLGSGEQVNGTLPKEGCSTFGPNPAAAQPGESSARPADPDSSGGYYQLLRVLAPHTEDGFAVGATRLDCGIAGATQEQAVDFSLRHHRNENPALEKLIASVSGKKTTLGPLTPWRVKRGQRIELRAEWPACPTRSTCGDGVCGSGETVDECEADCKEPHGCQGAESFVQLDAIERKIVEHRESIRVSWFATNGAFEHDRSGRAEDQAKINYVDNTWTAPLRAAEVNLWVVLRDNRGGVAFEQFVLDVK